MIQRHRQILAGVMLAFLALGVLATPLPTANAAPGSSSPIFDRQFIDMMVPHHQGAVAMARVALRRGHHPQIKTLARNIIASQTSEIGRMKTWRKAWYGSSRTPSMNHMPMLPGMGMNMMGGMGMDMMADARHLRTARSFDRAFITAMIPHHQMAVVAARLELKRGSHPQLKALARAIIRAQKREIAEMKRWYRAWFGTPYMPSSHMQP